MEKISILCPTRHRPNSIFDLIYSVIETAKHINDVEIIFYVDFDDGESIQQVEDFMPIRVDLVNLLCEKERFKGQDSLDLSYSLVNYVVGRRILLSQCWNECYAIARGNILMHCGDDIRFRTKGWDDMIRKEFEKVPDKIVQVFGDDGIMHQHLATHSFIHRNWVETLGYFVPPYFSSDFNDTWLDYVARQLDRQVYLQNMYTEHMHWLIGKGEKDQNALENLERHNKDNVEQLYENLLPNRIADVEKLKKYIINYQKGVI
jgi:hypothetical protein